MKKVAIVYCGAYSDSGYGCQGEWRCLKAAAQGEGFYDGPSQVVGFVKCECPGRTFLPNLGMTMHMLEMKPDVIHLSSCLVKAIRPYEIDDQGMHIGKAFHNVGGILAGTPVQVIVGETEKMADMFAEAGAR